MGQKVSSLKGWVAVLLFLGFAYIFPRVLVQTLGPAHPWTNYLYLYGFGFFYTGSGLLLAVKTGACNLSRPKDRLWFKVITGGFIYFASLHAVWIYLSLSIPFKGGL